ncbi:hypothetical protein DPMN_073369 [Dreissena polymorpha]|uniref:Uncharacterized protein n=1 Tax=Dreissena polymorpha TaxID=45954 RepID=A0A9D4HD22_DREPO|nr:hypothetical protein DPMN_073369 [Dreissena polymorpha]
MCTTDECRNYIPTNRQLCYQHDGSNIISTTMAVKCDRTLVGNSLRVELKDKDTQLVLCDIKISQGKCIIFMTYSE